MPEDRLPSDAAAEASAGHGLLGARIAYLLAQHMPDGRTMGDWLDALPAAEAERDELREAVRAIPRHMPDDIGGGVNGCPTCQEEWPCPTERLHRLAEGDHRA